MAPFYPVYARRSDGKVEVVVKGKLKEVNQPTDDQLDQKPDKNGVSDFYREVGLTEPKNMDWRRKLGGMLARELQWKDKSGMDSGYILVAFPENYRLYEHVKRTEQDGKTEVKSRTHAAGGDRHDAYLYGHPIGRRKRFRSPNDFFPHLLWLCTDETGDPDNCTCKICSSEDAENIIPGFKAKAKTGIEATAPMSRSTSAQGSKIKVEAPRPTSAQPPRVPTPLPPMKTHDQIMDSQYGQFLYRPGELVWFARGQAWGIGAVTRRWNGLDDHGKPEYFYAIQPLSYPGHDPGIQVKPGHQQIRPWLAWSVPKFLHPGLNDRPEPPRYETADWQGMMQNKYGNGDMEVDGSILAAKMIDASYTPIGRNKVVQPEPGVTEVHYDGIFLGAEKVWCGEAARLHIGSGTDIMVVHSILERKRSMGDQVVNQAVNFVGDIYQLVSVPHSDPNQPTPASQSFNPHLPPSLTKDLEVRNAQSVKIRRIASYWKLMSTQTRLDVNDIKGRWYAASVVMPIILTQQWQQAFAKGEIQEASLWMNSRGDSLNSNRPPQFGKLKRENNRKEDRRQAFARALPASVEIKDGVQAPSPPNMDPNLNTSSSGNTNDGPIEIDPRFDTADDAAGGTAHHGNDGGLDEFMNLDGMDHEGASGFGQYPGGSNPAYY